MPALTIISAEETVRAMRRRRTPEEIDMIRKTAAIGDAGLDAAFRRVRAGVTARDVEAEGVATMLRLGCERASINVVSGPATHYLDSGNDGRRTIRADEMIFMDISISYRGYLGDQTRPAIVGEGTPAQQDLLETIKTSFYEVRGALVPGARARDVYAIHCRNMERKGWRKYFYHHISHGVGLGGSDAGPRIDATSEDILQEGDVISCEPGIYVPGIGGARIEDVVHVTKEGPVPLTRSAIDRVIPV
jgi:Xaa-Pro aminopeptidase